MVQSPVGLIHLDQAFAKLNTNVKLDPLPGNYTYNKDITGTNHLMKKSFKTSGYYSRITSQQHLTNRRRQYFVAAQTTDDVIQL